MAMEFSVKASLLLDEIDNLFANLDKKDNINPIFNNLHIEANNNKITLWIENDYENHLVFIEDNSVSVKENGAVIINKNKLMHLFNLFSKDSIISIRAEDFWVTIFDPREVLSIKINGELSSLKQQSDIGGETILSIQQSKLKRILDVVSPFIGENDFRAYLNGALFKIENDCLKVFGADGLSIACVETELKHSSVGSNNYVISKFFLDELSSIISLDSDELVEFKVFYKGISSTVNNHSINSSLIMEEYPDVESRINLSSALLASFEVQVSPILDCLKQILSLSISSFCSLVFAENKLIISCTDKNVEIFRKEILVKGNDQNLTLTLNLENLIKTLLNIRTDNVIMKIYKDSPFFVEFSPTIDDEIKRRFILAKMQD